MDRQKIVLFVNKYISYLINIVLVGLLIAAVGAYIMGMIQFANS